jgi:3-oxoacyl-[acyl-carrier-protein] synthase II
MELALESAATAPGDIGFVSGHGTATDGGDVVESQATHSLFGSTVPFHSMKGHFGHTLGACGALEAWLAIEMMREGWMCPTANLVNVDPRCADLDYVMGEGRAAPFDLFMSNNFAFGGINTSLVFKAV